MSLTLTQDSMLPLCTEIARITMRHGIVTLHPQHEYAIRNWDHTLDFFRIAELDTKRDIAYIVFHDGIGQSLSLSYLVQHLEVHQAPSIYWAPNTIQSKENSHE